MPPSTHLCVCCRRHLRQGKRAESRHRLGPTLYTHFTKVKVAMTVVETWSLANRSDTSSRPRGTSRQIEIVFTALATEGCKQTII